MCTRGSSGDLNICGPPPDRCMFRSRDLVLALFSVRVHRAELADPERPAARRRLAPAGRRPGPGESSLITTASDGEDRCKQNEREGCERDVHRPLQQAGGAREPERRQADERQTFDGVELDARADEVEEARHDVDLHFVILHRANQLERLLVESFEKAMITRSTSSRRRSPAARSSVAEQRHVAGARVGVPRLRVDEPDEVQAVLRMRDQLSSEQLRRPPRRRR